ncbi:MAG: hypothetical protein SNH27_14645 [Rikenellaceae bacterium]
MKIIIEGGVLIQSLFIMHIEESTPSDFLMREEDVPVLFVLDDLKESPLFYANIGDRLSWFDFWRLANPLDVEKGDIFTLDADYAEEDWRSLLEVAITDKIFNIDSITFKVDFARDINLFFRVDTEQLPVEALNILEKNRTELPDYYDWCAVDWDIRKMSIPRIGECINSELLMCLTGISPRPFPRKEKECEKIAEILYCNFDLAEVRDVVYQEIQDKAIKVVVCIKLY